MQRLYATFIALITAISLSAQGWPSNYDGVMLQGFYWDSTRETKWYLLEKQADDLSSSFSLIWVPQSGNCGAKSMGYDDLYWFDQNSSFGSVDHLRSMIKTFKDKGLGTIADIVINHRKNLSSWVDFPKETYKGVDYELKSTDICSGDDGGEAKKWADKNNYELSGNADTGEDWDGMRDLDHKSKNVQKNVNAYLDFLINDLGYTGFRYDMVKGYSASFTKQYNEAAKPKFSVGECWDGTQTIRNWIDGTEKTSAAFDFQFRYTIRNAIKNNDWSKLSQKNDNNWPLVSNDYENGDYRQYAVTFVENHDTEYRSAKDQQDPIRKDTIAANAYMLAMPGTPCVFYKHWQSYKSEIKAMIEARKLAGITNTSSYSNFKSSKDCYANIIKVDNKDRLLVVVGNEKSVEPNSSQWTKILSGYHYAYYLSRDLETAWADKGSGEFSEAFYVKLTTLSNNSDAKLVYTTDDSTPSATNGKQVASGTTIKIDATTKLKVGLLVGNSVTGIISRTYTYKEVEPSITIPDFCKVNPGEVCAFFESLAYWYDPIYCWAWTDSPSDNFTFANGDWPGVACELIGTNQYGNKVWKWTWDGTKQKNSSAKQPAKIIFSSKGKPQTADLTFVQGGYYDEDGLISNVETGVSNILINDIDDYTSIYSLDGRLVRTDGKLENLPKGIYIVNKKKVILK